MSYIRLSFCIVIYFTGSSRAEIPPSHVRILDEILANHVNYSSIYKRSMTDIILGRPSDRNNTNFDYRVLDHASLVDILDKTKKIHFTVYGNTANISSQHSYRRQWYKEWWDTVYTAVSNEVINLWNGAVDIWNYLFFRPQKYPYFYDDPLNSLDKERWPQLTETALTMMRQSIYAVRYRLQDTNHIRKMYGKDPSYHIGTIVSNVHQLVLKCDNLYARVHNFPIRTHFIWPLIIYEKILAASIDVTDLVKRAFHYQNEWHQTIYDASNEHLNK